MDVFCPRKVINTRWVAEVIVNVSIVKLTLIPSAGVGGLCVGIFSSLQGRFLSVGLCALQCAKNSVGQRRQSFRVCQM